MEKVSRWQVIVWLEVTYQRLEISCSPNSAQKHYIQAEPNIWLGKVCKSTATFAIWATLGVPGLPRAQTLMFLENFRLWTWIYSQVRNNTLIFCLQFLSTVKLVLSKRFIFNSSNEFCVWRRKSNSFHKKFDECKHVENIEYRCRNKKVRLIPQIFNSFLFFDCFQKLLPKVSLSSVTHSPCQEPSILLLRKRN